MEVLQNKLEYKFNNVKLLENALNHSSYANEVRGGVTSNERLEFLGDSVLSVIVASYLFENFKTIPEGELTKLRASLVCEKSLCGFSRQIGLGEFLHLGKGEEKGGGRERDSILADAFEAVLAAIYLDGGMKEAENLFYATYCSSFNTVTTRYLRIIKLLYRKLYNAIPKKALPIT